MALADVERAILDACARNKFRATVVEPGRHQRASPRWFRSVEVMIPYSDAGFAIRYDSGKATRANEHVAGLVEVIEADLDAHSSGSRACRSPRGARSALNPRLRRLEGAPHASRPPSSRRGSRAPLLARLSPRIHRNVLERDGHGHASQMTASLASSPLPCEARLSTSMQWMTLSQPSTSKA